MPTEDKVLIVFGYWNVKFGSPPNEDCVVVFTGETPGTYRVRSARYRSLPGRWELTDAQSIGDTLFLEREGRSSNHGNQTILQS